MVNRGIRILRLSLCTGAAFDFLGSAWLLWTLRQALNDQRLVRIWLAISFYSLALAITLATIGAVRLVAYYAPHGNRRLIRVLALAGMAMAVASWLFSPIVGAVLGPATLNHAAWIHTVLALGLLLGLRLARL